MATLALNVLLTLALLSTILISVLAGLPSGPEGPVGAWLVFIPALFFLSVALAGAILLGRFDWVAGGRITGALAMTGLLIGLTVVMFFSLDAPRTLHGRLMTIAPYLVLICTAWAVNGAPLRAGVLVATSVLGLGAVGGWGFLGFVAIDHVRDEIRQSEATAARDRQWDDAKSVEDAASYQALPADASISDVLHFMFSPNETVKRQCRERLVNWPNLDEELIANLDHGDAEWAARFIGETHPKPSAKLAPAFIVYLDKGLEQWRSTLLYDKYAAKWEPNMSHYIQASRRIQEGGGDLRPHLKPWYDLVSKAPGLTGMAMEIKSIMELR
ncbi:MAG: hypothetical protein ABJF23_30295 [Bryobacteraceae bacterium]